jgi:enoyl-CoA hydratase/carnithine racemase
MTDRIKVEFNDGVAHVRLNRPEKKNALDAGMFEGLLSAARSLREDLSVRAVVLSGEGGCFNSGADRYFKHPPPLDPESDNVIYVN